jgi:hypothetical protein
MFSAGSSINGITEKPVRSEAESLGDNDDDLPIKAIPPSVACSMPEYNEDQSLTGALKAR